MMMIMRMMKKMMRRRMRMMRKMMKMRMMMKKMMICEALYILIIKLSWLPETLKFIVIIKFIWVSMYANL